MRSMPTTLLGASALMLSASAAVAQPKVDITRAGIGFGDRYKVGSWTPLRLEVVGGQETHTAVADVRVPDGEGTSTRIVSPPFSLAAGSESTIEVLVRIGRLDASVDVRIVDVETGRTLSKRNFVTRRELDSGGIAPGEPATTRLVVEIGPTHMGTSAIGAERTSQQWFTQNVVGRVTDLAELPRNAVAYEAVDTVLLSTSDRDAWAGLRGDDPRMVALADWIHQGGRAILFCGKNADVAVGSGGPLAALAPGEFTDMATVDDLSPLENFVKGNHPLPGRGRLRTTVPRLDRLAGDVDLVLGGRENELPLVIHARKGLGTVVFVALDVDTPPIKDWEGRAGLVEMLLDFPEDAASTETDNYYYDGPSDLVLTLVQRLDQELENSGIRTPPFLAIAGLVVLYILLIGPGDYFLVKHVLKRMEWTWITFPTLVLLTCLAAYWYANYLKGDALRVNRVEIVDIDNSTGAARVRSGHTCSAPPPSGTRSCSTPRRPEASRRMSTNRPSPGSDDPPAD